ncbi:MAG: acetylglutamate kinase [Candidatus Melainabacteria bacterium]|nr:acetylglutamate kinase [Candidatus Melainabacteria bacterium]MBI3309466.1 acetylglutamate kinase [Candidatus Melainabacteria bacterium]
MRDPVIKRETVRDLLLLRCVGIKLIIVHGGGPEINAMSQKLNLPVKFIDGYRVTDAKTMEIVEMVLVGKIQKDLVNLINVSGGKAIGLCGKDGRLFFAKPFKKKKKLGFIGEVKSVDISILLPLLEKGFIPVISSVGADIKGQNYNINADDVASVIASSLSATKLILMTDQDGILKDPKKPSSLISLLNIKEVSKLIKKKVISGGMIPKVNAAVNALKKDVKSAHILNGNKQHSILLEVFTDGGIGTMITRN